MTGKIKRERIDKLMVERGLADSRTRAQALVMAGYVLVNEKRVSKSSEMFLPEVYIRLKDDGGETRYVGRGGLKLERALDDFHICPNGYICIDIGASTGGFTDCLLQKGAKSVAAIDSGTNQLVWKLRNDPRVLVSENTNARGLLPSDFPELFDLAVMDVSFISVTKLLHVIYPLLKETGRMLVLIKPQFEVGKGEVGKGGIVREPEKHQRVVNEVNEYARSVGFVVAGTIESPILGAAGNKEFLSLYEKRCDNREEKDLPESE